MTRAKPILPREVRHEVRRTARREYRFQYTTDVRNIVGYALAYCLKEFEVDLYAFCLMSNHYHGAEGDRSGKMKAFRRTLNSFIARSMNLHQKTVGEKFFESKPPGSTIALDPFRAMADVAYVALNPVRSGVVEKAEHYPGLLIGPWHWGETLVFKRPKVFYKDHERFPDKLTITPVPPPGFGNMPLEEARAKALELIEAGEKEQKRAAESLGKKFEFGQPRRDGTPTPTRHYRKRKVRDSPDTPNGAWMRRPTYSSFCRDARKAYREFVQGFRSEYGAALLQFREGDRDVEFPDGTTLLAAWKLVNLKPPDEGPSWYRFYTPPPGVVI